MAVDFELYDLKTVLRIDEAARLWCEIDKVTDETVVKFPSWKVQ